ncbi:MAG: ChbG/HpnK family deacetylase [Pseudomonadota bacterium]
MLVRVDDAGTSLAANQGCELAVSDGIARSIEVMMPGAWISDAAQRFAHLPGVDIGIHLTLTSEWDRVKWRPLTNAPSLVDDQGFFHPLLKVGVGDDRPSVEGSAWNLSEVEAEFRAQIELGIKLFPQANHISSHMTRHFEDVDHRLGAMVRALAGHYGLLDDPLGTDGLPRVVGYPPFPRDAAPRVDAFIGMLAGLTEGTSIFVDHPAVLSDEMHGHGHDGYEDVAEDRASCLAVLTDPRVAEAISRHSIELISYRDLS